MPAYVWASVCIFPELVIWIHGLARGGGSQVLMTRGRIAKPPVKTLARFGWEKSKANQQLPKETAWLPTQRQSKSGNPTKAALVRTRKLSAVRGDSRTVAGNWELNSWHAADK